MMDTLNRSEVTPSSRPPHTTRSQLSEYKRRADIAAKLGWKRIQSTRMGSTGVGFEYPSDNTNVEVTASSSPKNLNQTRANHSKRTMLPSQTLPSFYDPRSPKMFLTTNQVPSAPSSRFSGLELQSPYSEYPEHGQPNYASTARTPRSRLIQQARQLLTDLEQDQLYEASLASELEDSSSIEQERISVPRSRATSGHSEDSQAMEPDSGKERKRLSSGPRFLSINTDHLFNDRPQHSADDHGDRAPKRESQTELIGLGIAGSKRQAANSLPGSKTEVTHKSFAAGLVRILVAFTILFLLCGSYVYLNERYLNKLVHNWILQK